LSGELLAVAERLRGEVKEQSLEASGLASRLGLKASCALLTGPSEEGWPELVKFYDEVVHVKHYLLAQPCPVVYSEALAKVVELRDPKLVVMPHSSMGMELAPYLAAKLGAPVVTDVVDVEVRGSELRASRYLYGGKVLARVRLAQADRYVLTLRPGAFKPAPRPSPGRIVELSLSLEAAPSRRLLGYVEPEAGEVDIAKAQVIVSVGRGLRDKANLPAVEELAKLLGGVVACSRPRVDKGWLPKDRQVGNSGKTVKPRLYLALGISGAFQHVVGMKDSDLIIAVNKDPNAPIFNVAHYGVVEDLLKVVDALKQQLKKTGG